MADSDKDVTAPPDLINAHIRESVSRIHMRLEAKRDALDDLIVSLFKARAKAMGISLEMYESPDAILQKMQSVLESVNSDASITTLLDSLVERLQSLEYLTRYRGMNIKGGLPAWYWADAYLDWSWIGRTFEQKIRVSPVEKPRTELAIDAARRAARHPRVVRLLPRREPPEETGSFLNPLENQIMAVLKEPKVVDHILAEVDLDIGSLQSLLLQMQISGHIKRAGPYYLRA